MSAVQLRAKGRVAVVTLANPPVNALGEAFITDLGRVLDWLEAEPEVRVAVVRSAVEGYFAAGADLKLLAGADDIALDHYLTRVRESIERLAALPVVTIAAVEGRALGGGLELAMACSLRVAAEGSALGLPEVRLGVLAAGGGTQRLPRLVGRGRALDLLLTGRAVDAGEAMRIGLVDRVAARGEAEAEASSLATELATHSKPALAAVLRCADAARDEPLERGLGVEGEEARGLLGGADAREGIAAFVEKRPPRFA